MANNDVLNFYSLFRTINHLDRIGSEKNAKYLDLFTELFMNNTNSGIPVIEIGRGNVLTGFLNGSYIISGKINQSLNDFLTSLEDFLCQKAIETLNEFNFQRICDKLKEQLNTKINNKNIKKIIENSSDGQKIIIDTITKFNFAYGIKEEIIDRLANKDTITMLTWVMLLSLFPEIRETEKGCIRKTKIYKCFLNDDILWEIVKDGIPKEDLDAGKLKTEIVSGLKNYSEEELDNAVVNNNADDIPDLNSTGRSRLLLIRYLLLIAYKEYCMQNYKRAKNISSLGIEKGECDINDEDQQYGIIKLKYVYALSLWKLKDYLNENKVLEEMSDSLFYTNNIEEYRLITVAVLKLLGTSANRNFDCKEAVQYYGKAYDLTSSTNYMQLSSLANNLAVALRKNMQIDSSCYRYDQSLKLRSCVVSEDSFESMRVKMNYAAALGVGRQYEKAIMYATEAYEYRKKAFENGIIRLEEFNMVTIIFAKIHIHEAWDMISTNTDKDIDLKKELIYTDTILTTVETQEREYLDPEKPACQDILSNQYVTRGLYHYLISFNNEKIPDDAKSDFERLREISQRVEKTNTRTIHAALCEIIEGKIYYRSFMKNNDEKELKASVEHIKHGFSVIEEHYNSLIEEKKSCFAYYYGGACFHLGALLSLSANEYVKEEHTPLDYLKTAQDMFEKCSEPNTDLPVDINGMDLRKINKDAFGMEKETIDKFIELLDNQESEAVKQDLFIKFYIDIFIL